MRWNILVTTRVPSRVSILIISIEDTINWSTARPVSLEWELFLDGGCWLDDCWNDESWCGVCSSVVEGVAIELLTSGLETASPYLKVISDGDSRMLRTDFPFTLQMMWWLLATWTWMFTLATSSSSGLGQGGRWMFIINRSSQGLKLVLAANNRFNSTVG